MTVRRLKQCCFFENLLNKSVDHLLNGFDKRVNEKIVLGQVPVCTVFHEFAQEAIISLTGQNDYWNLLVDFPDLLKGIQTI